MTTWLTRREAMTIGAALAIPLDVDAHPAIAAQDDAGPAAAPPAQHPPDLANLHELMEWICEENAPQLSFLNSRWESLDEWKAAARPALVRHLAYQPTSVPLSADIVSREDRDGFVLETVRIKATSAYDIPAKVLLPTNRSGRVPGVLAMHDHSGQYVWGHEKIVSSPDDPPILTEFRDQTYGRPYAELLARQGYVVVVIDAFYFGARRLRVEELNADSAPGQMREALHRLRSLATGSPAWLAAVNNLCGRYEHLVAKTIFATGTTWPGILTWDDQRSLDYLCSRPEVDASRIGCLGLSIGALRTARLIGVDSRIKVAGVTGWMTEFPAQLRNHLRSHTWMAYIPGLHRSLDLPDIAGLTAPGALLVQQCERDTLYPLDGMKGSVDKLAAIYKKAGIAQRFRGTFYDQPHSFRPPLQDEAFAWLQRWL